MSTPDNNGAAAVPSASANASDVMSAIQRVLAEHNLSDARFILEFPSGPPSTAVVSTTPTARAASAMSKAVGIKGGDVSSRPHPLSPQAATAAVLLNEVNATPAAAPPTLPVHQQPPPRARSASAEPAAILHNLHPTPPSCQQPQRLQSQHQQQQNKLQEVEEATSDHSLVRPSATSKDLVTLTARDKHSTSSLMSPLQNSLQFAEPHATSATTTSAGKLDKSIFTSSPAEKNEGQLQKQQQLRPSSPHATWGTAAVSLSSELAELRRLSREVAQEVATVNYRAPTKESLHSFVGRSAILDDCSKRQSSSSATSQWSPSNGLPLFPTSPPAAATASASRGSPITDTSSTSGNHPSTFQPPSSFMSSGAVSTSTNSYGANRNPGSVAIGGTCNDSLNPGRAPTTQRRCVVLVSSPDRKSSTPAGGSFSNGTGSTRGSAGVFNGGCGGGNNGGSGMVPSAGSLPSLVAMKKSAKPGRTPVFSILNKEDSRFGEAGNNSNNSTYSSTNTASINNNISNNASLGGSCTSRPLTPSSARSGNNNNTSSVGGSVYAFHHSRPTSVSLMADDRNPPSPVFQPLMGSAAEEQAFHRPGILVQQGQQQQQQQPPPHSRPFGPPDLAVTASGRPTPTPPALPSTNKSSPSPTPPLLWSEQSRENAQRALQLQSRSRLSQTTEIISPKGSGSGDHYGGNPGTVKHRRPFNPALSGHASRPNSGQQDICPATTNSRSTTTITPTPPPLPSSTLPSETSGSNNNVVAAATTTTSPTSSTLPRHRSLRELLLEQQQLEDASRRGMAEHAKLMQAAHTTRTAVNTNAATTTPTKTPYTPLPPSTSSSSSSSAASLSALSRPAAVAASVYSTASPLPVPAPPTPSAAAQLPLSTLSSNDANTGNASVSTMSQTVGLPLSGTPKNADTALVGTRRHSGTGSVGSGSGIQVVKFTLPQDAEARQSAVQQLCCSPAGGKHVDSKDRYRALLASQKEDLTRKDEKEENYKELLSRAVEYKRLQSPQ